MTKDRRWLQIAILSLFLTAVWAGISAYAKLKTVTIPPDVEKISQTLDPTVDRTALSELSKRGSSTRP